MSINLQQEIEELNRMNVTELQRRYAAVFDEPTRSGNKDFLRKRIAWRIQARAEGGISDRARERARELAREEDLRIRAPKGMFAPQPSPDDGRTVVLLFEPERDERLPTPGTLLGRVYKGERLEVEVLEEGFRYEGRNYPTLTAIAKEITGSHWNGFDFFGLRKKSGKAAKRGSAK